MLRLRLSASVIICSLLTLPACSRGDEPATEEAAETTSAATDDSAAHEGADGDSAQGAHEPATEADTADGAAPEADTAAGDDLAAPEGRIDDLSDQPDLQLERREVDGMQLRLQGGSQLGGPRPGALIGQGLTL